MNNRQGGFTLLEVLVATAILGITVTIVLQLFSAGLRTISISGDFVTAATRADAKMREVLDDDMLSETSYSESTDEGYRMDIVVSEVLQDRTENLFTKLLQIELTIYWFRGEKQKSLTLRTFKLVKKEI